jgi:hypothetical protein
MLPSQHAMMVAVMPVFAFDCHSWHLYASHLFEDPRPGWVGKEGQVGFVQGDIGLLSAGKAGATSTQLLQSYDEHTSPETRAQHTHHIPCTAVLSAAQTAALPVAGRVCSPGQQQHNRGHSTGLKPPLCTEMRPGCPMEAVAEGQQQQRVGYYPLHERTPPAYSIHMQHPCTHRRMHLPAQNARPAAHAARSTELTWSICGAVMLTKL